MSIESISLSSEDVPKSGSSSTPKASFIDLVGGNDDIVVEAPPKRSKPAPVPVPKKEEDSNSEIDMSKFIVPISQQRNSSLFEINETSSKTQRKSTTSRGSTKTKDHDSAASKGRWVTRGGRRTFLRDKKEPRSRTTSAAASPPRRRNFMVQEARSAREFFDSLMRKSVIQKDPRLSESEVVDMLDTLWNTADDDQRAPYLMLEEVDLQRFNAENNA